MAFDKNQLVMHQLQVKAKRLESGLKGLVDAMRISGMLDSSSRDVVESYDYALGCLGGEYLKKELFEKGSFGEIVCRLRDEKFMRSDVAEKNLTVWKEKHECVLEKQDDTVRSSQDDGDRDVTLKTDNNIDAGRAAFGTVDENGDIVPVKREQKCEYAPLPAVETKGMSRKFGFGSGGDGTKRDPIYCY